LSAEAQKLMDDLREEAMRVKSRLVAEREEMARNNEAEANAIGMRKMAQPKGKAGRFSDVHMAGFRKMDSIADHPSSFRAQPGRLSPAKPALKRKQSQAQLDEREENKPAETTSLIDESSSTAAAKRVRKGVDGNMMLSTTTTTKGQPAPASTALTSLDALSTPTKSSLARAVNNNKGVSQIPALSKSPSKASLVTTPRSTQIPTLSKPPSKSILITTPQNLAKPAGMFNLNAVPKSEPRNFIRTPGKVARLKSMLRHPSASARKPVLAASSLPVSSFGQNRPNFNKELPSVPKTPEVDRLKQVKRVAFTPDTIVKNTIATQHSPSPIKSGIPRSTTSKLFGKSLTPLKLIAKPTEINYPMIADHPSLKEDLDDRNIAYPSLNGVRPLPAIPQTARAGSHGPPSVPGTFTFRSDHTIDFGASPKGFGSSSGQASVRQVRPSFYSDMPGTFPSANKENTVPIPSIPHGISNKKRHRASSEDDHEEEIERSPKKVKVTSTSAEPSLVRKIATAKKQLSQPASTPSKRGMTLSRLNMLARPKLRK
jgi:hypothetical protein